MNRLSLRLLGAPQAQYRSQLLKFRSRKVLALLVYLVVEQGQHERDKLAALFWPESDQKAARTSLRNTLARLRGSLAVAGEFIQTEGSLVGLDLGQSFELDLHVVEEAVSALATNTDLETLGPALAHLRGEFLEGFSLADGAEFEQWITVQRKLWQHKGDTLFAEVVPRHLERGSFSQAVETASRWRAYSPLNETAHHRLIEAYALAGDRTAALQAYEVCLTMMAEELGIALSPELVALGEQIKKGQVGVGRQGQTVVTASSSSRSFTVPLVGRETEFGRLVKAYRQSVAGNFQSAVIVGEAGMGKTRLANTFLEWAELDRETADVLRGRAFEIGGNLPYQPVVDALRLRIDRENAPEDLLDDVWLAELSQLLPELRGRYPDLPQPMAGSAGFVQSRLFEAVANLGIALAERQPLILFIDDVQWADSGSLELLHYLARRWTAVKTPAMLLMTVRLEGLLTIPALKDWLTGLGRDVPTVRLELAPLTRVDLSELAQRLASGDESGRQFGDWLAAETGGSPFFVTEMLRLMQQQALLVGEIQADGLLTIDASATIERLKTADRVPLPPTVRELILSRLSRLSDKAASLLLAGAVIGRQCSFERLCQVARIDEFEGLPAVESLLNGRLMLETADERRPFTFAHDNIRDVVYTEAGTTRRRLYHRQAFQVLEQDKANAAELAFHALAAGLYQPAYNYAAVAGDEAMAVYAYADAAEFYKQALDLVDRVDVQAMPLPRLCTSYGRALELSGRYQEALDHYVEATANAKRNGDKELELAALVAQCTIYSTANELSDFGLAESLGKEALVLAQALEDKGSEAKLQWILLNVYRFTSQPRLGREAGERSLALAKELDLREQMAYAANDLMYLYQQMGNFEGVHEVAQTALASWRELGNQPMLTDVLAGYGNVVAMTADYETALAMGLEAQQISTMLENEWSQSFSYFPSGLVHKFRLEVEKALDSMDKSLTLARKVGFTGAQIIMGAKKADLLMIIGALNQARAEAQKSLEVATKHLPLFAAQAAGSLARIELKAGRLETAEALLEKYGLGSTEFDAINSLSIETATCLYYLTRQNYEKALAYSSQVAAFCKTHNIRTFLTDFLYFQGQAIVGLKRPDEALELLHSALTILRDTGGRWHYWEIAELTAELEEQRGDRVKAAELRQEAQSIRNEILAQIPAGELRSTFEAITKLA